MEIVEQQEVWTTAGGVKIPISELTHQHLSNILWFFEVIHRVTNPILEEELHNRFYARRLLWRPLPISGEIAWLRRNGYILGDAIIYTTKEKYASSGYVIGSISHINPEDK